MTFGLLATACGGAAAATAPSATAAPTSTPPRALIQTADLSVAAQQQTVLTDGKGLTLYYFMPEKDGKVVCTGDCASTWHPLLLPAGEAQPTTAPALPGQVDLVGRADGTRQATYDGWPLYTFAGDKRPGDLNGQGIAGQWFAVPEVAPADADGDNDGTRPPPSPPTAAPVQQPAPPPAATPAPRPAFNDGDGDNKGGPSDGDGNG